MTQSRSSSSLGKVEHHGEPSERLHGVHSTTKMYMHNTHAVNENKIEPPNIIAVGMLLSIGMMFCIITATLFFS